MSLILVLGALAVLLPWAAVPAARHLAVLLPPRAASLTLAGSAVLLAIGTIAALAGLFHVPFLAGLEHLPLSHVVARWPAVVPVSSAAGVLLTVQAVRLALRWRRQRVLLARAWALTGDATSDGDLLVVAGRDAEAFALPGHHGRAGRVVVSAGMLSVLSPAERAVLLAHERAHLRGRHHLLSAAADLAAAVHPALGRLRPGLDYHLERWADEQAAGAVADRRTAATAIARAALAGSPSARPGASPLLSVSSGPVPQRVQALLAPEPARPTGRRARAAAALLATVAVAALFGVALAYVLHEHVEYAAQTLRVKVDAAPQ
ncbi:M48 family metalloprotease [Kitasatospora sp. CM 4170]|uniref:M48 family metalloprotease n=1 Tax=Kitasatospora aburaviensis TaxID=67265 RepID=A0ABW1F8X7_9ACTN|nr:M48 family metalloprotease [Kitasatospora sp. CM 4170]WNM49272.1 M48 family metalloprotease [Kitasatospora sp. CM 4170]